MSLAPGRVLTPVPDALVAPVPTWGSTRFPLMAFPSPLLTPVASQVFLYIMEVSPQRAHSSLLRGASQHVVLGLSS